MGEITFEDERVNKFLKDIGNGVSAVTKKEKQWLTLMSAIIFKDIADHFKKEEGPDGAWAAWSISYQKHMESIGRGNNQKLQFSGKLRNNFLPTNYKTQKDGVLWYNNAKTSSGYAYAWGHNEGDGKLPQREFMWAKDETIEEMSEQTLKFITDYGGGE